MPTRCAATCRSPGPSNKTQELALHDALRPGHNHIALALARVGRDGVAGEILTDQSPHERLDGAIREQLRGTA